MEVQGQGSTVTLIDHLAQPRLYHEHFKDDRRSVYWIDKFPPETGPNGFTVITASERVQELAEPKKCHVDFRHDRSVIWDLPKCKNPKVTQRLHKLSEPKSVVTEYRYDRPVYTEISNAAKQASASKRIEQLAVPKRREENLQFTSQSKQWGEPPQVSQTARRATASARVETLAEPRYSVTGYEMPRKVPWNVSDNARNSIATTRVLQLSRPLSRVLAKDDYDPYKISYAARNNQGSSRLDELSVPLNRKLKKKFIPTA